MAEPQEKSKRSSNAAPADDLDRSIEIDGPYYDTLPALLRSFFDVVVSPRRRRSSSGSRTPPRSAPRGFEKLLETPREISCNGLGGERPTRASRHLGNRQLSIVNYFAWQVGSITLVALTGLLVFMLFFVAATVNAIIISLLVSLAAAGGCLALFFCFLDSNIHRSIISCSLCYFHHDHLNHHCCSGSHWVDWILLGYLGCGPKKLGPDQQSVKMTGSAISAYSAARQARRDVNSKSAD
uniref:Uncharacterized protein n=1 Tax=Ananas comosus var. bracteatus TaxID=296719 RepID=A0A6V7P6T6_ANACO|nr:unnamed protein product [Ananas comosus var. bracteatus]